MSGGIVDGSGALEVRARAIRAGRVAASIVRNTASTILVFGVAFLIGFRPHASAAGWVAAAGILLLFVLAISWLAATAGLLARSAEAAGRLPFPALFLPYPRSTLAPIRTIAGRP